ncbi:MAG: glycogen synthase GlgA [Anaerovoracaceae bacterium]|jgi:starch synthase
MKILFISTEAEPFAKSGGLGDVIGSLPRELNNMGLDARVMLPLYQSVEEKFSSQLEFLFDFKVELSWRTQHCGLFKLEYEGVIFYFIDNKQYFGRENYYGYYDDGERCAYYAKAALESISKIDFNPDILHCNEWQTALVPVYLKTHFKGNAIYDKLRTIFTIHNIEYQGKFEVNIFQDLLGISPADQGLVEYHGLVNYMKGAIVACDKLTTVSPSYAEEITYPFYGRGLEDIIGENQYKLSGILNGIDTKRYDPTGDVNLAANYSINDYEKKSINKEKLQKELNLNTEPDTPLIAMVSRLVEHKGFDLVLGVFDEIMEEKVQFAILGTGEVKYENFFRNKAIQYKGRVSFTTDFLPTLASRIYAGSDLFLMPSVSEPCGLSQMIALRYGSIPIVRETGGLKDSIEAFIPDTGKGNGITFATINAHDMLFAIKRGLKLYENKKQWPILVKNGMGSDFSWEKPAREYVKIYKEIKA